MVYTIAAAEKEITERLKSLNKKWYPNFHLAGRVGWINDPNGLVFYKGWYHAFYQHHPYGVEWGPMHWGHARSKDMIVWQQLPIALAPEGVEDKDGCFSGSAVVNNDELSLIYTGHKFSNNSTREEDLYQVQCLATSCDGIHFTRHGIIVETPQNIHHFRDPKVWQEGERWYMVVGVREEDIGYVYLYSSLDLRKWHHEGVLAKSETSTMGYMWECPDFFKIEDKYVLLFSPQGIKRDGYDYVNLFQSGYIIGHWAPGQEFKQETAFIECDHGDSFYAPQTFLAEDNRRVLIGWMAMWENNMPESQDGWAGQLTLPREITLNHSKNRLIQKPIKELDNYQHNRQQHNFSLKNKQHIIDPNCHYADIVLTLDRLSASEQYGLSLGEGARLYIDSQAARLILERNYPDYNVVSKRSIKLPDSEKIHLRLIFDKSSLEVFVNDGDYVLSSRLYPCEDEGGRALKAFSWGGEAVFSIEAWQLDIPEFNNSDNNN